MKAGVPCSRYRSVAEAMADPQCAERGLFVEIGEGDAGYKVANVPYLMSATPVTARPTRRRPRRAHRGGAARRARPRRRRARRPARQGHVRPGARMRERSGIDAASLPGAEERALLRDSLRGFLAEHWPAGDGDRPRPRAGRDRHASGRGSSSRALAGLGSEPAEGGLRELVVAMEELGRAACPAPLLGAGLANLALARQRRAAAGEGPARRAARRQRPRLLELRRARPERRRGASSPGAATGFRERCASSTARRRRRTSSSPAAAAGPDSAIVALGTRATTRSRVVATRALGADGWCRDPAGRRAGDASCRSTTRPLADLLRVARLALLARAHGAARRAFEMAVDYAKERKQFGQPIGRFQAIQHKLAEQPDRARRRARRRSSTRPRPSISARRRGATSPPPRWRSAARPCARSSLETQHAFGAIGYAEEHEAPRHFRRAHLDTLALGGAAAARRELAAHLLDDPDGSLPEYDLGAAGNAFRAEVRAWLQQHWSGERKAAFDRKDFHDREFDAGVRPRPRRDRLARPRLAARVRRPGAHAARADRLHRDDGAGRGAAHRRRGAGERADDVRHARAAAALPARDPARRGDARHGLQRARRRLRPGVAAHRAPSATATSG